MRKKIILIGCCLWIGSRVGFAITGEELEDLMMQWRNSVYSFFNSYALNTEKKGISQMIEPVKKESLFKQLSQVGGAEGFIYLDQSLKGLATLSPEKQSELFQEISQATALLKQLKKEDAIVKAYLAIILAGDIYLEKTKPSMQQSLEILEIWRENLRELRKLAFKTKLCEVKNVIYNRLTELVEDK